VFGKIFYHICCVGYIVRCEKEELVFRFTRRIENKAGHVTRLSYCGNSVILYRLKTINFKYFWTHTHRVFYV